MKELDQKVLLACEYKKAKYIDHIENDDSTVTITAAIKIKVSLKDLEDYATQQTLINEGSKR